MNLFAARTESGVPQARLNAYNFLMIAFVSIGSLSYGYAASIIGTTLGQPTFIAYFELATRSNGTGLLSATNGLFQAGGVLGTLTLPLFADRWGRKGGLAVSAITILISGAILAGSTNIAEFLVFRFVSGGGTLMILAAVPLWMSEVVPAAFRGALVNVHAISLLLGYIIQGWVGFGFFFWKEGGNDAWRIPLALACVWPLILLLGLYWVPESPRWLALHDRADEAKAVLMRLHDDGTASHHAAAAEEFHVMMHQINIERTLDSSWMNMLRTASLRKRALITLGVTGWIQCSGVLVINNYGPTLYKTLQYSAQKSLLLPAIWLTAGAFDAITGSLVVDRFPRNKWLATGVWGCMACLVVEAALVANFVPSTNTSALIAAVCIFFIFGIPYQWCLDGVQFTYISEIWPTHYRAKGMSLGVSMISLMNVIWLSVAPTAFETIGWKFYLCFIVPGSLGGFVIWFLFPDTKGLPLEEVAAIFGDQDSALEHGENVFPEHGEKSGVYTTEKRE